MIDNNKISIELDKWKTVCVSGHRKIYGKLDIEDLEKAFKILIDNGYKNFLIGMALGFDTICFQILEKLRNSQNNIKIIACIPCPEQDKLFSYEQKSEYKRMLNSADERIVLSDKYTPYCMIKRNKFMVDNSCFIVAYLVENRGGTFYTVNYAKGKGLKSILITKNKGVL